MTQDPTHTVTSRDVFVPVLGAKTPACMTPRRAGTGFCRRAQGHHGRHVFYWIMARTAIDAPRGRVRYVWADTWCQVCGRGVTFDEGAVCRKCGPS